MTKENPDISWKETFCREVSETDGKGYYVWDPIREVDAIVTLGNNGDLIIRPTENEGYPISVNDAAKGRLLWITRENPIRISG